jgi:hypothetical protein
MVVLCLESIRCLANRALMRPAVRRPSARCRSRALTAEKRTALVAKPLQREEADDNGISNHPPAVFDFSITLYM